MQHVKNYCMSQERSCSACCGIYNLRFNHQQLQVWLGENTCQFLQLDLRDTNSIVAFRQRREDATLPHRYRLDIYVCPFVGYLDRQNSKTGCLLHPAGSPHPQISLLSHPQNFSFYGESICQNYDCLSKERRQADFLPDIPEPEIYGRLISRADILGLLQEAIARYPDFNLKEWLSKNRNRMAQLTSTSFETPVIAQKSKEPLAEVEQLLQNCISN